MAVLASAGASSASAEPCVLDNAFPVTSVAPFSRPTETGGYAGTVTPLLRGADIRVAAQPGLTAEWLERRLEAQVAASECQLGADPVFVEVVPVGEELVVRVTATDEGPGVTRLKDTRPDQRAANEILRRAQQLTR